MRKGTVCAHRVIINYNDFIYPHLTPNARPVVIS